jgi:hypothetical protein
MSVKYVHPTAQHKRAVMAGYDEILKVAGAKNQGKRGLN